MSVKVKIGMEMIKVNMNIPDSNVLLSVALGAPVMRDRHADRMVVPYPAMTNFRSPSYEHWVKHMIYDSVSAKMDLQFSSVCDKVDIARERKQRAYYYDGTYLCKNSRPNGAFVYAIAYNDAHKLRLKNMAKTDDIDINEIITVDYGNFFYPKNYVHANRWLAAIIGAMFADTVYIPNTDEFWGELDRSDKLYYEGANWISRYYQRKVNLVNPLKKKKYEMKDDLKRYPICKCGNCMECYTSYIITEGNVSMDGTSDKLRKTLETAVRLGRADEYLPYV